MSGEQMLLSFSEVGPSANGHAAGLTAATIASDPCNANPFLKWAGGKRQLLPEIRKHDLALVRKLYEGFEMRAVMARRAINSKGGRRGPVGELLIW